MTKMKTYFYEQVCELPLVYLVTQVLCLSLVLRFLEENLKTKNSNNNYTFYP